MKMKMQCNGYFKIRNSIQAKNVIAYEFSNVSISILSSQYFRYFSETCQNKTTNAQRKRMSERVICIKPNTFQIRQCDCHFIQNKKTKNQKSKIIMKIVQFCKYNFPND